MKGVWIAGPSRTGTSMTAGLFAAHGVFFGNTRPDDKDNERGYFEHPFLKSLRGKPLHPAWPKAWWETLRREGWPPDAPWGVKGGPQLAPLVRAMNPTVVVMCVRPLDQVQRSRDRCDWAKGSAEEVTKRDYDRLERIALEYPGSVFRVGTDSLARRDYRHVLPVFWTLGIPFNETAANEWIDPNLWGRT